MLIIKFLRFIFSSIIFLVKMFGVLASAYLVLNHSYDHVLVYLPTLNIGVWLTVQLLVFLNDQFLGIQCALINLYKIKDEKLKIDALSQSLEEKEKYLRDAEIFLAKQVEKHNQAKKNLKKEVHEYHQELVNDFILKNSKCGTEN